MKKNNGINISKASKERLRETILCLLSFFFLFVDSINGFVLSKFSFNSGLSLMYKLLFLVLCIIYLLKKNIQMFLVIITILFYVFSWAALKNIFGDATFLITDFSELLKLFTAIIVAITFSQFRFISPYIFLKLFFTFQLIIIVINVFFSLLGIGEMTYGTFGAKGFFYGGNSLSSILILIFGFFLFLYKSRGDIKFFAVFILFMLLAILIGTKGGVLGLFLITIFLVLRDLNSRSFYLYALLCSAVVGLFFINAEELIGSSLIQRILYFYEQGGIARVIFSGRDDFFTDIYPTFLSAGELVYLWGFGHGGLDQFSKPLVEMDVIDIVFKFGFVTLLLYLVLVCYLFANIHISHNIVRSTYYQMVMTLSVILFFIGLIAGHVFFNGIVAPLLGIMLSIPVWEKNYISRKCSQLT